MALVVELSICIGLEGCGCPISLRMFCILSALHELMCSDLILASAADNMTAFSILVALCMMLFLGRNFTFSDR